MTAETADYDMAQQVILSVQMTSLALQMHATARQPQRARHTAV